MIYETSEKQLNVEFITSCSHYWAMAFLKAIREEGWHCDIMPLRVCLTSRILHFATFPILDVLLTRSPTRYAETESWLLAVHTIAWLSMVHKYFLEMLEHLSKMKLESKRNKREERRKGKMLILFLFSREKYYMKWSISYIYKLWNNVIPTGRVCNHWIIITSTVHCLITVLFVFH